MGSAAGCIPQRDNPFDPENAPRATLRILDLTTGEGCAAVTDSGGIGGFPSVVVA